MGFIFSIAVLLILDVPPPPDLCFERFWNYLYIMVKICKTVDANSLGPHDMSSALNCVLFFFVPYFCCK